MMSSTAAGFPDDESHDDDELESLSEEWAKLMEADGLLDDAQRTMREIEERWCKREKRDQENQHDEP